MKATLLVIGLLCVLAFAPGTNAFEQSGQATPTQEPLVFRRTVDPENKDTDGKFRKIKVKVNRKGLQVRARKGHVAPFEEERPSK